MKVKTSELIDEALDWVVAKCENGKCENLEFDKNNRPIWYDQHDWQGSEPKIYSPSNNSEQGDEIIDRKRIATYYDDAYDAWAATGNVSVNNRDQDGEPCTIISWNGDKDVYHGSTRLIAAMRYRCYSVFGPEVEVPDELVQRMPVKKISNR